MPKQARIKSGISCQVCAAEGDHIEFSKQNNLTRHMASAHPPEGKEPTRFQCTWRIEQNGEYVRCSYMKEQKINLVEHIESAQ